MIKLYNFGWQDSAKTIYNVRKNIMYSSQFS